MNEQDRRLFVAVTSLMLGLILGAELARAKERRRAVQALERAKTRIQFGLDG